MKSSVSNLSVVASSRRPLARYVEAPVGCLDASRKLFVLTLPGLLKPCVTGRPHGLFDPGAAGKRMAYAPGRPPFSHEATAATTHCVAVALQIQVTNVYLFGALARIRPLRRRPRQRLFTRGKDLRGTVILGRHWIAPRGRQEILYKLFVPPLFLGPALHSPGFDDLSADTD